MNGTVDGVTRGLVVWVAFCGAVSALFWLRLVTLESLGGAVDLRQRVICFALAGISGAVLFVVFQKGQRRWQLFYLAFFGLVGLYMLAGEGVIFGLGWLTLAAAGALHWLARVKGAR